MREGSEHLNTLVGYYHSPLGWLQLSSNGQQLLSVKFTAPKQQTVAKHDDVILQTIEQLKQYFQNKNHHFDLALADPPTAFQQKLRQLLLDIPPGKTIHYGQAAAMLNSSARAIGQACRANPIPVIVPCHRITAKNHLGGYAGQQEGQLWQTKTWLLQHEGWVDDFATL